jgi:Tfp pilus assembly protein PilV
MLSHRPVSARDSRRARPWQRRDGMTMSEVLIAAVILAFVIMSSLTALSQAYGFTRHARMVTLAGQISQSVMEDLRLRNFTDIDTYAGQSQPVTTAFSTILASERFSSNFTRSFVVTGNFTRLVTHTSTQLGKVAVTITVTWTEQDVNFSRSLTTYFGERGLTDYYYVGWAP